MAYLQQQSEGVEWNAKLMTDMLNNAGASNKLAAAKWLRQQGAEWPDRLHDSDYAYSSNKGIWSGEVLQWARDEGCTSPI
jgi:hypothetical protein